ncbi:MAG: PstS family phosphate ABC transporter substrate-binding protein [Longimicrobiales bacterium]|nr:PstS family phosphate ABC transporter substrate-binding protein [Longimicrobiales bacterium]
MAGLVIAGLGLVGCGGGEGGGAGLTGQVQSDGSSTVFPVAEAIAEEFQIANPGVRVTVGVSGTGGGISRFCGGEIDIVNASREMTEEEQERCEANGVEFIEMPVAWDGLSVVVNPANDFIQCVTVEELRRIWQPDSQVQTWRDVRSDFPDEEIQLYGPGTDSGTFDYFTETLMGESGASRADYQASEDDNVLVQGVAGDRYSLGYFGYAYYAENEDALKVLGVDDGTGCVTPSPETIDDQSYAPLSRPLYIYVKESALERPEVDAYVQFMMNNAEELVPATGYIPLSQELYQENLDAAEQALSAS